MFAAMRLRLGYKSKRPKDRPTSLPYVVIGKNGVRKIVNVRAERVPRHWIAYITYDSPGVIVGKARNDPALVRVYPQIKVEDLAQIAEPGESVQFAGSGDCRDLARFLAKIAHAMAVAEYGLDAFEPWLPKFILGQDDCAMHYYVAGHENKTVASGADHMVSLGTWEDDGLRIGATVRLFCNYGGPNYEIAVGKFKVARQE
jgi:hypothetical protein